MFKRLTAIMLVLMLTTFGCSNAKPASTTGGQDKELKKLTVLLDWVPNTNHTGLYVAKEKGYFAEEGLDVEIVQPAQSGGAQLVASGKAQFAVSTQEEVTMARTNGVPIVSIAAVIQHNTSSFASKKALNITSPKDFEGKRYGGWGSPVEEAVIKGMMAKAGGDAGKVEHINIGTADFFQSIENNVDFAWIFEGWTGVEARLKGIELNSVLLRAFEPALDYYTPVLITNEDLISNDPELVKAFLRAVTKGYKFSMEQPEEAAAILVKHAPETNAELAKASQVWLRDQYQAEAARWGEQKPEVWQAYTDWLVNNKLMEKPLDVDKAFTNEFLPN